MMFVGGPDNSLCASVDLKVQRGGTPAFDFAQAAPSAQSRGGGFRRQPWLYIEVPAASENAQVPASWTFRSADTPLLLFEVPRLAVLPHGVPPEIPPVHGHVHIRRQHLRKR